MQCVSTHQFSNDSWKNCACEKCVSNIYKMGKLPLSIFVRSHSSTSIFFVSLEFFCFFFLSFSVFVFFFICFVFVQFSIWTLLFFLHFIYSQSQSSSLPLCSESQSLVPSLSVYWGDQYNFPRKYITRFEREMNLITIIFMCALFPLACSRSNIILPFHSNRHEIHWVQKFYSGKTKCPSSAASWSLSSPFWN